MVTIRFCINGCDLGCSQTRVFTQELGGKATSILRIECNGFGRQIRTRVKSLLPGSNLIPHGSSLLSAQLDYRRSFWRDNARNSADNIPPRRRNCADKPAFRRSPTDGVQTMPQVCSPQHDLAL